MTENIPSFYNYIVKLSNDNFNKQVFQTACDDIIRLIMQDFHNNVKLAAEQGHSFAYLCIYHQDAKYKSNIPIHDFLMVSEAAAARLAEFQMESILEKIQKHISPFKIELIPLANYEIDKLMAVIISWPI